ncbi:MAG TPA: hypothetical protein VK518_23440 [Puia sp.]|nr:hypothetical protein [Puia sp.]
MLNLVKAGRWFFAICLMGLAGQQFYYSDFRPVFVPPWAGPVPGEAILTYLFSTALIGAALAIILEKKARTAMLILGALFLVLLLFCHIPYELVVDQASKHIGVWGNAFKELAFAGGAFAVAGSFPDDQAAFQKKTALIRLLELFIPMGGLFFSITMIVFGIDHFLYVDFVATLVPDWIPAHLFWTYLAAVALIGAGVAIILRIRLKLVGILLGTMIFLWFIFLHIPRAAIAPPSDNGNELTSVFEALGFSGVAFILAYGYSVSKLSMGHRNDPALYGLE